MNAKNVESILSVPVLPIRDRVVFPHLTIPLVIGRDRSVKAVQKAMQGDRLVFIVAQRHVKVEEPSRGDLFEFGTVAEVVQSVGLPEGLLRIRVLGRYRAKLLDIAVQGDCLVGDVQPMETESLDSEKPLEMEALRRMVARQFEQYAKKTTRVSPDLVTSVNTATSLDKMADTVADALAIALEEKQDLIELIDVPKRLRRLVEILNAEIEILNIERRVQTRVHRQIEKNQKEYYLNEQMRAIQKELKRKDDHGQEMDVLREKIKKLKMPAEAEDVALKEVERVEKMMPFSPEATVVRSYLEWLVSMPWSIRSKDHLDLRKARKILDDDHFGLEKPKERLLEYMAVLKLTQTIKGPILCFVGPAGTGKTSLAKSMARAMGRQFVRISLGGVRDESEIRGHRRTYIGSMPGRIIQALRKTKTKNPILLLDEIDKMGTDWRGDPAAALLEVLDPEQNKSFVDHYLDVGFDLSEVIFIATANSLYEVSPTLLDRLEVIRFSAYTTDEKVAISNRFVMPKELREHGLSPKAIRFQDDALRKIIHVYTQEAGVRGLQRKIAQVCRKVAMESVSQKKNGHAKSVTIGLKDLHRYLGAPEYIREKITVNAVGIATGLAWTDHGGETLTIEATTMPGQGKVTLTGKLGAVMQESAQAALSLVKSRSDKFRLASHVFRKKDLHIHIPEGAVPKDGPSAGIALATAILSAVSGRAVRRDVAMTGEVTLGGRVLPIGGLKEKVIAAFRDGVKTVLYPEGNKKDLPEIPESVRKSVKLISVKSIDDVFRHAVQPAPVRASLAGRKMTAEQRAN